MNEEPPLGNDRQAAEEYRRQRQEAEAVKEGNKQLGWDASLQWVRNNRSKLLEIAERSGATGKDQIEALAEEYLRTLSDQTPGSDFDDPGTTRILRNVLERIESACSQVEFPTKGGVVFGNSSGTGLVARQLSVLLTDVSIIETSIPFVIFCDLVSKAIANALPDPEIGEDGSEFNFNTDDVKQRLKSEKWILAEWTSLLARYAAFGTPPKSLGTAPHGPRLYLRGQFLDAMEVFAIAHEYGHHALNHGFTTSANDEGPLDQEHDADMFARSISLVIGSKEESYFLSSAVGAPLILAAIELVARARAVLATGQDHLSNSETHPPVAERIRLIDDGDSTHLPSEIADGFIGIRRSVLDVLDAIWAEVRPVIESFHAEGLRPVEDAKGPSEWLPLTSATK